MHPEAERIAASLPAKDAAAFRVAMAEPFRPAPPRPGRLTRLIVRLLARR